MLTAQWSRDGVALVDLEPPALRPGWVRLGVLACGICGSDLHAMRRTLPAIPGLVPGHEMVGVPLDGPAGLADAIYAVEPRVWCGGCAFCTAGDRHLCATGQLIGVSLHGGLAERVDVPRESLHRVPQSVDPLAASIAEPLAVCVRAIHLARLSAASRVLVLGAGTIGLLAGLLARDRAAQVAITARHPHQKLAAKSLGLEPLSEADLAAWAGEGAPDVVIETVGGIADTLARAVDVCRPGGRIVVLGVFSGQSPINALAFMLKELTLVGSNTYSVERRGPEFATATALLERHRGELRSLQTHQFPLTKVADAFACAADKTRGPIKVSVVPE